MVATMMGSVAGEPEMILRLLTGIGAKAYFVAALIGAFALAAFGIRRSGVVAERNRQRKRTIQDIETAREIEDEVSGLDDVGLARRANKWVRRDDESR